MKIDGVKVEGTESQEQGSGGSRILSQETRVVIKDTKFDEGIWIRVPGERGTKDVFGGNICMSPKSKSTANDKQRGFGKIALVLDTYRRDGEIVEVGDLIARVGKVGQPGASIGHYEKDEKNIRVTGRLSSKDSKSKIRYSRVPD